MKGGAGLTERITNNATRIQAKSTKNPIRLQIHVKYLDTVNVCVFENLVRAISHIKVTDDNSKIIL